MSIAPPAAPRRRLGAALIATVALVGGTLVASPPGAQAAETGTVTAGTTSWGLSSYLTAGSPGRPKPIPESFTVPAAYDADGKTVSWGDGTGSVGADGSAGLAFDGQAVVFAPTGGGWLRIADVEADLDADGNGTVTAVIAYGTSVTGSPGARTYDPEQEPVRGPERVDLVDLADNTAADADITATTASWTGLDGLWSDELLDFLDGDSTATPAIAAWSYATTIRNVVPATPPAEPTPDTDRRPAPFAFTVSTDAPAIEAEIVSATYADGIAVEVDGTGFRAVTNPGDAGVYVGIAEAGGLPDVSSPGGAAAFATAAYVGPSSITDGAFSADLEVATADLDPDLDYAVYTWQAHSHSNTTQDTETALDIDWADLEEPEPEPAPTTSVSITGASYAGGLDLSVSGSNFRAVTNPGDAGVYVGLAEAGGLPDVSSPAGMDAFLDAAWITPGQLGAGSFATALHADTAQLDSSKSYAVYTWQAHSHSNTTQDTVTTVSVPWGALAPPEPDPTPSVTVSTTSTSHEGGLVLAVSGQHFRAVTNPGDAGVYVGLAEAGGLPTSQADFAAVAHISPEQIVDGAFSATLTAPTASLDPSRSYAVYTWQAHTHSNPSQDTATPVTIDWSALEPPELEPTTVTVSGPARSVYGTTAELVARVSAGGGSVTLTGVGPAQTVDLTDGSATFVVPATLGVGAYTAEIAYAGDETHAPSTATRALRVVKAPTELSTSWDVRPTSTRPGVLDIDVSGPTAGQVRVAVVARGKTVRTRGPKRLSDGAASVRVGKFRRSGLWKVKVVYLGTANYEADREVLRLRIR